MFIQTHEDINTNLVSKVFVLYTGGTIGMTRNKDDVLVPAKNKLSNNLEHLGTFHDKQFADEVLGSKDMLVLPTIANMKRIAYSIYEWEELLDSSNMTFEDWSRIARDIGEIYNYYDGFVVLHGTDTLSYTASALSFMLQNLGKTVVVTGSQIPCFETRSDGRDNIINALIFAGNYTIPEVCVYFDNKLMRGNRTVKVSAGSLYAFDSPNLTPLAHAMIDIDVDYQNILRPSAMERFKVVDTMCKNVAMLRLYPSIMASTVRHFLQLPIQGVVLQCYGSGNVPSNRLDILDAIREGADRGVLILVVTQCSHGGVSGDYETGQAILETGAISGSDITQEAALAKLAHVLSLDISYDEKREMMKKSLFGEMTVQVKKEQSITSATEPGPQSDLEMLKAVALTMNLSSKMEVAKLKEVLFPCILCSAVYKNSFDIIDICYKEGANISAGDYDMRTPLHISTSEGNLEMTKFLLERGALVHMKDRNNDTPLICAVRTGNVEVVKLLVSVGAHLSLPPALIGENLCAAAKRGDLNQIMCWLEAGADLNMTDLSGNTCLDVAAAAGLMTTLGLMGINMVNNGH